MKCERVKCLQRFGKWTVLSKCRVRRNRKIFWNCRCECGEKAKIVGYSLRDGSSTQCTKCQHGSRLSLAERFAKYVSEPDANGCINWKGGKHSQAGYGVFYDDAGLTKSAHVIAWELVHGPVPTTAPPDGSSRWEIHHKCHNVLCVCETHLQLVTSREHGRLSIRTSPIRGTQSDRSAEIYKHFPDFKWHRIEKGKGQGATWAWSAFL
jgi:hypothetical protein